MKFISEKQIIKLNKEISLAGKKEEDLVDTEVLSAILSKCGLTDEENFKKQSSSLPVLIGKMLELFEIKRPFKNYNGYTAVLTAITILKLNDIVMNCSHKEIVSLAESIDYIQLTKEELTLWILAHSPWKKPNDELFEIGAAIPQM